MQGDYLCGLGTVSIRKHVKLPMADTYTHGKYVSFLEEEAVEQVQLCGGRFLVHTKWSAEAIKSVGTSDDEFKTPTEGMQMDERLEAPAVVYKVTPAKFRELEEPLMAKVAPHIKLPPLYVSAKEAGISWADKADSSSSSSSSSSSGSAPKPLKMVHPQPLLNTGMQAVTFRARNLSHSDTAAALDHGINIATVAEAAIARAHERHRLRSARHPAPVLAAAGEEGITADDDAAAVAALLETAASAGTVAGKFHLPWVYFSSKDPFFDRFRAVNRANCLAYATFSYSGVGRPNLRFCHPGRASNGPYNGLPRGWGAGWALPPVQRAAVELPGRPEIEWFRNDYDISRYLPASQGGVLVGPMGGAGAAGGCATLLSYLQAGVRGDDGYAGDALLSPDLAAASRANYHPVYVTFHRFAIVYAYNPRDEAHKRLVRNGNPVNVWDTRTHMLRIRTSYRTVEATDIPVVVWFENDNPITRAYRAIYRYYPNLCFARVCVAVLPVPCPLSIAANDYHFHRRNIQAGRKQQWSDKNGEEPTRCCWSDPEVQDDADAGTGGYPVKSYHELIARGHTQVLLGYRPCGFVYSRPSHLLTREYDGYSRYNCANPAP